jgi:SAM-dependent methyltransferase
MNSEFDRHRQTYRAEIERSIGFVGQDLDFFTESKARSLLDVTERHLGSPGRLAALDVGCGPGLTDRFLAGRFASLHGVDVSEGLLDDAARANPWATYTGYDGRRLPFPDETFDVTFAISVVHHLRPADRSTFAREMARVTRPRGLGVVFEHNPYNPLTRMAVARCDFDHGAILSPPRAVRKLLLWNGMRPVEARYILFFPWRGAAFAAIERRIGWLPLGAQYLVAATRR